MGYNFAGSGDGDQVFLMPPDPRDWLPEGHLAWAVRRAAAELDLAPFLPACRSDGQGSTAYHPQMMVALVMYCYCKGIRSSRAIEMATWDDVGARVICGGLHPDHATNARFVARHKEPLKGLLVQSLVACAREGLVRVDVAAGDGTKVKANASCPEEAALAQCHLVPDVRYANTVRTSGFLARKGHERALLTSAIHTKVKSSPIMPLSCGNTLKLLREPAPFGCGPQQAFPQVSRSAQSRS
jgi:transposase